MVAQTVKGSRGAKPYGKILILAFGLAVIAVMVVHKLRERRILNLIVEEKDQQLISLQLLLQRELDFNKEMIKKIEDLKPRFHMLRSQKMELNGRVVELQSTIASLKDEIRAVESALEVKNGENKMLREKITEILKEKDAEIDQLKRARDEQSVKVWPMALLNTTSNDKIVAQIDKAGGDVDLKRVEESKGEETGNVTRTREDDEEQIKQNDRQLGEIARAEMKLEVAYKSKHGAGYEKHRALSRTKRNKWRGIAGNKGSRKVSEGEPGKRFVAQGNEHDLQDSEVENGGSNSNTEENDNGTSDSEFEHDQHDPISHLENHDEEEENRDRSHNSGIHNDLNPHMVEQDTEADPGHNSVEEEKKKLEITSVTSG